MGVYRGVAYVDVRMVLNSHACVICSCRRQAQ